MFTLIEKLPPGLLITCIGLLSSGSPTQKLDPSFPGQLCAGLTHLFLAGHSGI